MKLNNPLAEHLVQQMTEYNPLEDPENYEEWRNIVKKAVILFEGEDTPEDELEELADYAVNLLLTLNELIESGRITQKDLQNMREAAAKQLNEMEDE